MLTGLPLDLITGVVSFIITLMVLSYVIGDNPLFRVAISIFVGVAAGYVAVVAIIQVLLPKVVIPLLSGSMNDRILLVVPVLLSLFLLAKVVPSMARLGNASMAFLAGAGAAVAVVGALTGTLFPQVLASINLFDLAAPGDLVERLFEGSIILLGAISTLIYFQFGVSAKSEGKRSAMIGFVARIGQVFIGITFGVLFAGAYAAALTALIERIHFMITFLFSF